MLSHEEGTLFSQAPFPFLSAVNTGGFCVSSSADQGSSPEEGQVQTY